MAEITVQIIAESRLIMERFKIKSVKKNTLNETDRLTLAGLLIKAGYCVRIVKEKKENSTTTENVVEYWEE